MIKNTLKEKQATLDVIETILRSMEYTLDSNKATLDAWKDHEKEERAAAKAEGREPVFDRWEKQEAERAEAFLKGWDSVEKALGKLI